MRAMVLDHPGTPLRDCTLPDPMPSANQVLVRVAACGVCRTTCMWLTASLPSRSYQSYRVMRSSDCVEALGASVEVFRIGDRVGIPWLGHTWGRCSYCCMGPENLCDAPDFTGYQIDGGYAELTACGCRSLLQDSRCLRRHLGGSPSLCRLDRLPRVAHGRRRKACRHLRLRCRRPYRGTSGAL